MLRTDWIVLSQSLSSATRCANFNTRSRAACASLKQRWTASLLATKPSNLVAICVPRFHRKLWFREGLRSSSSRLSTLACFVLNFVLLATRSPDEQLSRSGITEEIAVFFAGNLDKRSPRCVAILYVERLHVTHSLGSSLTGRGVFEQILSRAWRRGSRRSSLGHGYAVEFVWMLLLLSDRQTLTEH